MQENNVRQGLEDDEVGGSIEMYIDEFIEMLQEKQRELGVDAISFYVDEDGGVSMDLFNTGMVNGAQA